MSNIAKPVLKWAGGKRQLITQIENHLPPGLKEGRITKYVEPMIGGGAVFFHMKRKYGIHLKNYYISDYNWDLFVLYKVIQGKLNPLLVELRKLSDGYLPLPPTQKGEKTGERITKYKVIRDEYNDNSWDYVMYEKDGCTFRTTLTERWIRRAAITIFLNRTCFNGLYRVNGSGKFNVPHGRYDKPDIVGSDNLRAVSVALKGVKISVGTYEDNLSMIDDRTFVYFDPPYRPLPKTPSFKDYHKAPFGDYEQEILRDEFEKLDKLGAKLMLSNSDPKNTDKKDNFFDNLYSKFEVARVNARRAINSVGSKRGEITEILVTNYEVNKDES